MTALKSPEFERQLILSRDQRRKYGARVTFEVRKSLDIGELDNATLMVPDGTIITIASDQMAPWEGGRRYVATLEGFSTAAAAEGAGHHLCQALLACAVGMKFGMRFRYGSHEPPAVFDRTVSEGCRALAFGVSFWDQDRFLDDFFAAMKSPAADRRVLLSMELFAAAHLEASQRTKFVMAVSALEPLAHQQLLDAEASNEIDRLLATFDSSAVPEELRDSLRGRIKDLKRESVRQALKRLCRHWFATEPEAHKAIDRAYKLRSELLHEGKLSDPDVLLDEELHSISYYLRRIYQQELQLPFSS